MFLSEKTAFNTSLSIGRFFPESILKFIIIKADSSLLYCEQEKTRLQKFFNVQLDDKIQVVCFNKQSEFRQSNLGLSDEETASIGGATNILGNKMFVYFEGTDQELREQIALGLSRIMYLQLMYGGDWRSVVRGNNRIAIPTWYSEGVIRYAALKDRRESERTAEDWFANARYPNIHRLTGRQAGLVGHSFWSYIGNIYGENVVLGILNMTQLFRGTDGGFQRAWRHDYDWRREKRESFCERNLIYFL